MSKIDINVTDVNVSGTEDVFISETANVKKYKQEEWALIKRKSKEQRQESSKALDRVSRNYQWQILSDWPGFFSQVSILTPRKTT